MKYNHFMTQISKKKLANNFEAEVYDIFWSTISRFTNKNEIIIFFSELFTLNEKVNFSKRLSIAILLSNGLEWRAIRDLLKVSEGTIAKISTKTNTEGFRIFFRKLENDARWKAFWKNIAKSYLLTTHGDKFARLGNEGIEKIYFKKKKSLLH